LGCFTFFFPFLSFFFSRRFLASSSFPGALLFAFPPLSSPPDRIEFGFSTLTDKATHKIIIFWFYSMYLSLSFLYPFSIHLLSNGHLDESKLAQFMAQVAAAAA